MLASDRGHAFERAIEDLMGVGALPRDESAHSAPVSVAFDQQVIELAGVEIVQPADVAVRGRVTAGHNRKASLRMGGEIDDGPGRRPYGGDVLIGPAFRHEVRH